MNTPSSYIHLFSNWPLALRQAHIFIRTTRNPRYFEMADHFATLWGKTLEINGSVELLSGSNMAALDNLFEEADSKDSLQALYESFQQYTAQPKAAAFVRSYAQRQPENLEEAVALHVAFLTLRGYERIASISEIVAYQWLGLWQEKMEQQNRQQLEHSAVSLSADQSHPEPAQNFEEAVEGYLEKFGETSALSIAVVGALPFSPYIGFELLSGVSTLLSQLSPLYRLAQDMLIDLNETLNTAIYATAAGYQLSFGAARQQLSSGEISVDEVNQQLKKLWEIHFTRAKLACETNLYPYRDSQIGCHLERFYCVLLSIAQMLTGNWKS